MRSPTMLGPPPKEPVEGTKFTPVSLDRYTNDSAAQANGNKCLDVPCLTAKTCEEAPVDGGTKLYKRRFWMLFLFCICTMLNAVQFTEFSSMSNIIECYQNVTPMQVNFTTTVFMILYFVLVLPVSWFIAKFDLKAAVLVTSFLDSLSGVIQCFSVERSGFPLVLFSQAIAGVAQVFVLPLPPRLAALWFGPKEIGRAISTGVCANLFGAGLGMVLPPTIVPFTCSKPKDIKRGLSTMAYILTGSNLVNFILLLTTFKTKPLVPPNESSKVEIALDYKKSLLSFAKNFNFVKLAFHYGLATGLGLTFVTLLNQIVQPLFPGEEQAIGWMGFLAVTVGALGSFLAEYVLDLTHKFKETSLTYCIAGLLSTAAFTGLLFVKKIWVQFVSTLLIGFFIIGYFPVGLDFAAEITYPEPEGTSAGIMNTAQMGLSAAITSIASYLLQMYGVVAMGVWCCAVLLVSIIIFIFIKAELKRTNVNEQTVKN